VTVNCWFSGEEGESPGPGNGSGRQHTADSRSMSEKRRHVVNGGGAGVTDLFIRKFTFSTKWKQQNNGGKEL